MTFLRNCWYQAGWSSDVAAGEMMARTIIQDPLVIWRGMDGAISVLEDKCPHRFAPLSSGRVEDDSIVCGYHGLRFGAGGTCVRNPHGPISRALATRSFPAHERYGALWVWMGDDSLADPALIPDLGFIDTTPDEARITMSLPTAANYLLIADNILDLSHLDFIHPTTLGGLMDNAKMTARRDDCSVHVEWIAKDVPVPSGLKAMLADERGDISYILDWFPPGIMVLNVVATQVGAEPTPLNERLTLHNVTPETEFTSHYFVCSTRRFAVHDPDVTARLQAVLRKAFVEEDKPMIERQQARMQGQDFWAMNPALLPIDKGGVHMRRIMQNLIAAEGEPQAGVAA